MLCPIVLQIQPTAHLHDLSFVRERQPSNRRLVAYKDLGTQEDNGCPLRNALRQLGKPFGTARCLRLAQGEDGLACVVPCCIEGTVLDVLRGKPLLHELIRSPKHHFFIESWHVRGIGYEEGNVTARCRGPLLEGREETILACRPVDSYFFIEGGNGEDLWLSFNWRGDCHRDLPFKHARAARTKDLQLRGIVTRGKGVFVCDNCFEAHFPVSVNVLRPHKQAPPHGCKTVKHGVDRARLKLAECGG